ncbi:DUF3307 domain-containing protein [Brevibacillus fluminis]|uniref:DUF3307 domain-containing protein n=1 Tax=Brevibacillus fluminis TaxID=511487 RepID=UPI003F8979CE
MTLFEVLLVAHFVGDYLFQTSWMAMNKAKNWAALLVHCAVYTLVLYVAANLIWAKQPLSWPALAVIFFGHVILDRRTFVAWWVRKIMMAPESSWLGIMADQIFHLLLIAWAIYLS